MARIFRWTLLPVVIAACALAPSPTPEPMAASPTAPAPTATPAPPVVATQTMTNFHSTILNNDRPIDIFLPPGYDSATDRYPVLYANDGQDMPALGMKAALETLYARRAIEPIIVVAIHATEARLQEYGAASSANSRGLGAQAADYTRFLLEEVMPYVNGRYRLGGGPPHTVIMGASLGGLSAFDIAWSHPELFGKVGVFSGSFWWHTDDASVQAIQDSRIMHRVVRQSSKRAGLRFWFEAGLHDETDDRDGNGVIDAIQDTSELMDELATQGYSRETDLTYVEVDGGHNQATWARALPDFLLWAFAATP